VGGGLDKTARGGVEKPKKQVEHERQLEKIKKDYEGDYKKKAVIQLERKVRLQCFLISFRFVDFIFVV
jgi:hypothetical protein